MSSNTNKHIFRAYDIRGIYQQDIDPCLFYQIGLAAGTYVRQHIKGSSMTVGNDLRRSSHPLVYAFISGVSAAGINVSYTGTTSFGQTLFSGCQNNNDIIVFVTASHLPAEWNGVKFYYGDGVGLPEEELMKIRDLTLDQKTEALAWENVGTVKNVDAIQAYADFFAEKFSFDKSLRIAVDCGGASMTLSAPAIFKRMGHEVIPVFCQPDPTFSQRPSDPKPENLTSLISTVKEKKCDFGVAFDGDGDRSVIVDDTGAVLSADQTGIILGKHGLKKKGTVIANVECSKAVSEQLTPLGFNVKQIQVGHTFLTLHAKKEDALLGIESSGHLILPSYVLFDDALVVPFKIAEIIDSMDTPLSTLREKIPVYPQEKLEISCSDETKFMVIKKLTQQLNNHYSDCNTMDGIRVNLEKGWVLIRASNTSPIIRLTAEADTAQLAKNIAMNFKEQTEHMIRKTENSI